LIDTDILSMFFRRHPGVTPRLAAYLTRYKKLDISIVTYYEIISGLKPFGCQQKNGCLP